MATELQVQLVNELLKDNDALAKAVSVATLEKAELCRTISRLERTLKHHTQKGCVLSVRTFASSWHSACPLSPQRGGLSDLSILLVRELGFFLELCAVFPGQHYGLHPVVSSLAQESGSCFAVQACLGLRG